MKENKKTKTKILITNDDGIKSAGLKALWHALKNLSDITIVAPDEKNIDESIELKQIPWEEHSLAWTLNSSSSDCVKHYLSTFPDEHFDMIVSGINHQSNIGRNVFYSGTIQGIVEGALRNIFGIAFSTEKYNNLEKFDKYIQFITNHFLIHPPKKGAFANVCFPFTKIKGVKIARQGKGYWIDNVDSMQLEKEQKYWMEGKWMSYDEKDDSDVSLLKQGYITAVVLHVKETKDYSYLQNHNITFEDLYEMFSHDFARQPN